VAHTAWCGSTSQIKQNAMADMEGKHENVDTNYHREYGMLKLDLMRFWVRLDVVCSRGNVALR